LRLYYTVTGEILNGRNALAALYVYSQK
jgi:hypothetical protein